MGSFVGDITKWTCKSNFDFEKDWYIYIYIYMKLEMFFKNILGPMLLCTTNNA